MATMMEDERASDQKEQAPRPIAGAATLAPYKQGKSEIAGVAQPLKLSSNESMAGPSPKARAAYGELALDSLHLYPDGSQQRLRNAIGKTFDLNPDQILCGNGSDELISLVMRAYLAAGDEVIVSQYSFAMAFVHAVSIGAIPVTAPEDDMRPDTDAILALVTDKTRMVVIATPNNPVGQFLSRSELLRLRRELPQHVMIIIDSAYADYVTDPDYEAGAALVDMGNNCVMTRTFSKLYGLAALRIGWVYAPLSVIDTVQRIRTPFNANAAALAAAEAAILDQDYAMEVRDINNEERERLASELEAFGIEFIPSHTNFYMLKFAAQGKTAEAAAAFLESQGIIPRPVGVGGPEHCLRITVGLPEHNDRVIEALGRFMAQ